MPQAQLQEEQIPTGGIADFVMSDDEIAALEAEEAREAFGDSGIARFESIARRMASYGRYGDDTVAHVQKGELVVPRALIDQSPQLKASIFNHLRELGIEDPERYVVGSMENSINPETGMPEFFFKSIRRAVSNVAKGVSKAISNVGKVLKKVAPVVLPIALAMTPLGAIYGAALGSGIGTLIQGGNIKDALKSALISGAVGGITAGVGSKMSGGTFVGGVKEAAANPMGRLAQTGSGIKQAISGQGFGTLTSGYQAPVGETAAATGDPLTPTGDPLTPSDAVSQATDVSQATSLSGQAPTSYAEVDPGANLPLDQSGSIIPDPRSLPPPPPPETSFIDTAKGYGQKALDFFDPRVPDTVPTLEAEIARIQAANPSMAAENVRAAALDSVSKATPGMISRYAPLAGAAGAVAYGSGFFEAPPEEENPLAEEFQQTGADLIAQSPEQFMLAGRDPRYSQGQYVVGSQYGMVPEQRLFNNPFMRYQDPQMQASPMRAAAGGEVYPRRNGGIMPNEGIPNQDSVRALLMPGEFVMTTNAVKGLGGGSMNRGINNMYSLMRNLETRGRAA